MEGVFKVRLRRQISSQRLVCKDIASHVAQERYVDHEMAVLQVSPHGEDVDLERLYLWDTIQDGEDDTCTELDD